MSVRGVLPASPSDVKLLNIAGLPRTLAYYSSIDSCIRSSMGSSPQRLKARPRVQRVLFDLSSAEKMKQPRNPDSAGNKVSRRESMQTRMTFGASGLLWQVFSSPEGPDASVQADLTQVVLDDDVGDGVKHKLHILGVCGTSELGVDLLDALAFIQVLKLSVDVLGRLLVRLPTCSSKEQKPV